MAMSGIHLSTTPSNDLQRAIALHSAIAFKPQDTASSINQARSVMTQTEGLLLPLLAGTAAGFAGLSQVPSATSVAGSQRRQSRQKPPTVHQRPKKYACTYCPKSFSRASDLSKHHRTHTGEKPFICSYCRRAFADSSSLSAHKRIHTGEKPYVCEYCSRAFAVSSSLNKHRRLHTGERPYECTVCNKRFSDHSSYSVHRKRSHECLVLTSQNP